MDKATFNRMKELEQENEQLRKDVLDWKQTAQMLAMDLGDIEHAKNIYEDVSTGLYDKVRERLNGAN
jgi:hypothetical protein